ncbi:hypothetical protein EAE93_16705 [Photorhabdus akhurstii]|nr:hypothetical protein [Photorhabdus akhurstii]
MRYQAALLAENEPNLTALATGRQYLFDNHGLVADKNSVNVAMPHFHTVFIKNFICRGKTTVPATVFTTAETDYFRSLLQ